MTAVGGAAIGRRRFVVGTDEDRPVVERLVTSLSARGHEVERLAVGAWGDVALEVGRRVAAGAPEAHGIVCCWTGTGACIAANKVRGVRAALCVDAQTAAGARTWNDANVLALSLRLTSEPLADEILAAWLETPYGGSEEASLEAIRREERGSRE